MDLKTLRQFVKDAPDQPGIYRYQASNGRDLYIGKAASIKKRLTSYLKTEDSRIQKMITTADKVSFDPTNSDIEAMILESQMIKQKRPDFNIMLRDDKQYFYVAITREDFPHIFLTHQTTGRIKQRNHDIAEYIGPFTDGAALKSALRLLRSIFPYCTCTQKHHNRCLNYHIGKCL
ncbi:MAG TPA: GIY-YIG nuclease family protein, partial [Candidatus Paceibacterota bacterium]|nr:GIY-YIG nuclease family protein [Candidatus Paceibacterota bacterium]